MTNSVKRASVRNRDGVVTVDKMTASERHARYIDKSQQHLQHLKVFDRLLARQVEDAVYNGVDHLLPVIKETLQKKIQNAGSRQFQVYDQMLLLINAVETGKYYSLGDWTATIEAAKK
jgi:hypothetical protein